MNRKSLIRDDDAAQNSLSLVYAIDKDDRLIEVNDQWETFAEENEGGATLRPENVVGRSIWDYVRGQSLQKIYRSLIEKVRVEKKSVEFDYRCDSPKFKRFMALTIEPWRDGIVKFTSRTKRIERIEDPVRFIVPTGGRVTRRCSVCNRFGVSDRWLEVDELVREGQLDSNRPISIAWTVCKPCMIQHVQT